LQATALCTLLNIGNGATNAPQCWHLRDETSANTLVAIQREWREWGTSVQPLKKTDKYLSAAYPYGAIITK
jgi:hypothetical protein